MTINSTDEIYIIAELANTHEGDPNRAIRILKAVSDEADAIKFQAYTAPELTTPDHPNYDSFDEKAFSEAEWSRIVSAANEVGLNVLADVFGLESLDMMATIGIDGYKIHSSDISNQPLLEAVGSTGKPVYLSAGGSTVSEIRKAIRTLERAGNQPAGLLYGFQRYPTKFEDTHLRKIQSLAETFEYPIGFAPHLNGGDNRATDLPSWGVLAGAELLEIHVTKNRSAEPADYQSSLGPEDFATAIGNVQEVIPALGDRVTEPNRAERQYRLDHKKYVVTTKPISAGRQITADMITLKRVPDPVEAYMTDPEMAVGRVAMTNLDEFAPIKEDNLDEKIAAVLACRAESDRMFAKPMQLIDGEPILSHLIERLELVTPIDQIVLAIADTPSQSLFVEYAETHSYPYVVGSEPDVLKRLIEGAQAVEASTLVRVTTENPYIYWQSIANLIERHLEADNDLTTMESLPSGTHAEIISRAALERSHTDGEERHRSELCTLYINENPDVFNIERVSPPKRLNRPDVRLTVDYPSDLILARKVYEGVDTDADPIPLTDILEYLQANPDLLHINTDNPNETRLYD